MIRSQLKQGLLGVAGYNQGTREGQRFEILSQSVAQLKFLGLCFLRLNSNKF